MVKQRAPHMCNRGTQVWACLLLVPALRASSPPWGVESLQQTSIPVIGVAQSVLAPNGDIYIAGFPQSTTVSRVDATGHSIFTISIPGEFELSSLVLALNGNLYVTGYANPSEFVTTAGAYKSTATGDTAPFLCGYAGSNGAILFCTYLDMYLVGGAGLAADDAGNVYQAEMWCSSYTEQGCLEKFDSKGRRVYHVSLASLGVGYTPSVAPGSSGDVYVAGIGADGSFILSLDVNGNTKASVTGDSNEFGALLLDPAGNPQLLMTSFQNVEAMRVRRYKADLSNVLFETI